MVTKTREVVKVDICKIITDPTQPRHEFDQNGIDQLKRSMESEGLLQPISLRWSGDGSYVIVAGERRYRAAKLLGWESIPAIIHELDDKTFRKLQMVENVVRRDLNPLEYAQGLKLMMDEGMTAKEIGQAVGEDPGNVTFYISILNCRPEALHLLATGQIGVVVARQLANLDVNAQLMVLKQFQLHKYDADQQVAICQRKYAEMNQSAMFGEMVLSKEQIAVVKELKSSFVRACDAFNRLRAMEENKPGIIVQANLTQLDIARAQVQELKKNVDWLHRILKQKEALDEKDSD
jgi:ParB/RepB/Spo0J family partition protein